MKLIKTVLHSLLFGFYPVLYLFSANIGKMSGWEMLSPTLLIWAGILLLIGVLYLFSRNLERSAIAATLCWGLFCSYDQLDTFVKRQKFVPLGYDRTSILLASAAILAIALCIGLVRTKRNISWLTGFLNVAGFTVVLIAAGSSVRDYSNLDFSDEASLVEHKKLSVPDGGKRPDIYFILLDAFGREDILKSLYGVDNSPVTKGLRDLGFYVADQSYSNYIQTILSLGATLNMNYLNALARHAGYFSRNRARAQHFLQNNEVVRELKALGYSFVWFSSGYSGTKLYNSDVQMLPSGTLTEFQNLLLSSSPIPDILKKIPMGYLKNWQYDAHRSRIRYIFENLPTIPDTGTPRFTFAHILSPHPPFVFGPNGEEINWDRNLSFADGSHYTSRNGVDEYVKGYGGQVQYVGKLLLKTVSEIIKRSPDAIIVVQGDHGPGSQLDWKSSKTSNVQERFGILNAIYAPDDLKGKLSPTISPVNTFRYIFNYLFNGQYPILEDRHLFSRWHLPYRFIPVNNRLKAK